MIRFILVRLLQAVPTLLGVTFLSFIIIKMAPGDYLDQLRLNPQISPETIELLKKQYGLDKPAIVQYIKWLKSALVFDLGYSFQYHAPVTELIKERIGNTLLLTLTSGVLSWIFAIFLGFLAGFKEDTWIDKLIKVYAYTFMSFPSFFLAFILLLIASKTGILPVGGMHSVGFEHMNLFEKVIDLSKHMFVPVFTLTFVSTASMVRLVRSSVIEVLHSPIVIFLRAKGVSRWVMIKHIFKKRDEPFYHIDRL